MNSKGKPKITAVERLDHTAFAVGRDFKKRDFDSLKDLKEFAESRGYEINVEHSHGAGLSLETVAHRGDQIRKEEIEGKEVPVPRNACIARG